MKNLVSIIIPCYNQAKFLDDTLTSVFAQKHQNWECIIVNDGSLDNTEQVANYWVKQDSRFKYLHKKNCGLSSARNEGLEIAKGNYIQFLDADDYLHLEKIETSIKVCETQDIDIVVTNFNLFKKTNNLLPPYCTLKQELFTFNNILFKWEKGFTIPIHCAIIKSTFFKNFRFPEHLRAKEDWIMWITLFKSNPKVVFVNKSLAYYRIHEDSMTYSTNMKQDFLKAISFIETIVSENEYKVLLNELVLRFYDSEIYYKEQLFTIKNKNVYKTGYLIKRIVKKLGVLKLAREINKKIKLG